MTTAKTYSIYVQVDESFKLILFTKHAKQLFCYLIKLTGRGSIDITPSKKSLKNVSTNIGQTFLNIIDDEFPPGHPLHKIFNRNTVKISYSCMPNIKQTIDGHAQQDQTVTNRHNERRKYMQL
jgi:hypothetical protein